MSECVRARVCARNAKSGPPSLVSTVEAGELEMHALVSCTGLSSCKGSDSPNFRVPTLIPPGLGVEALSHGLKVCPVFSKSPVLGRKYFHRGLGTARAWRSNSTGFPNPPEYRLYVLMRGALPSVLTVEPCPATPQSRTGGCSAVFGRSPPACSPNSRVGTWAPKTETFLELRSNSPASTKSFRTNHAMLVHT